MFKKLFGKKEEESAAPKEGRLMAIQSGKTVPVEEVPDPVFSQKMLGDGVALIPEEGKIYSPVNGKIVSLIPSKHAYGIEAEEGAEVLIHIGLETVALNGEGFTCHVKEDQTVKAGDLLAEVDLELLKEKGYNTITPILITNMDDVREVKMTTGPVTAKETVMITYKK